MIGRAGVGVDNIDLDAATRQGIAVMNTPGANAVAVAEQTLGMMLAMARHLCRADQLAHAGRWEKEIAARHGTTRQDAGHRWPWPHWNGSGEAGPGATSGMELVGRGPVCFRQRGQRAGHSPGDHSTNFMPQRITSRFT